MNSNYWYNTIAESFQRLNQKWSLQVNQFILMLGFGYVNITIWPMEMTEFMYHFNFGDADLENKAVIASLFLSMFWEDFAGW